MRSQFAALFAEKCERTGGRGWSGVEEARGAEGDAGKEVAHRLVGGADAAEAFGAADGTGGAVDRQPVAADPARRQVRVLVAAEGEGAAAVVGTFVEADPVGDPVAAGRRFGARTADRHREAADHLMAVAELEAAPGERGVQGVAGPVDVDLGRVASDPAKLAVRKF